MQEDVASVWGGTVPGSCACRGLVVFGVVDDNGDDVASGLMFLPTDLCG